MRLNLFFLFCLPQGPSDKTIRPGTGPKFPGGAWPIGLALKTKVFNFSRPFLKLPTLQLYNCFCIFISVLKATFWYGPNGLHILLKCSYRAFVWSCSSILCPISHQRIWSQSDRLLFKSSRSLPSDSRWNASSEFIPSPTSRQTPPMALT